MSIRYLTARLAQQIDEELMSASGAFSIDQLMELAGLACAQTIATVYPLHGDQQASNSRVLVCCGPGNQGGDGLVAARHLSMFGYKPTVFLPKPGSKDIYKRLQRQTENLAIPTLSSIADLKDSLKETDVILDAIFGFSFSGPVRPPFNEVLPLISKSKLPIVSVDIPSGWDVEKGPVQREVDQSGEKIEEVLMPDVLISLTAPKEGVRTFKGRHFLGGRFVPWGLQEKFALNLPAYPGFEQIVELPSGEGQQRL
ncbi:related to human TGR-CL10C [Serendipita indica DSM 11827]|uniref:NAD(P)H-hydrate epimerase n=1 Tax=Serendipita indica (strain DSM 11827) TaxID=1109443 RepID=G4TNZ7_SERID|nr:related to human TGR-CL10C [Serendipita indica DSM 11827]